MMLPEFERFVNGLCEYYQEEKWPTDDNIAAAFRDVKGLPGSGLDAIASHIRTHNRYFPTGLSAAMHKAYAAVAVELRQAQARAEEQSVTLPTPEEQAQSRRKCQELLRGLATGVRPPWAGQPRKDCGIPGPDSYRRMG